MIPKKETLREITKGLLAFLNNDYSSEMQLTGQPAAQAPQLMQLSGLITNVPPLSEIAPTGQVPAHEPQPMHEPSSITYAILFILLKNVIDNKSHLNNSTIFDIFYQ